MKKSNIVFGIVSCLFIIGFFFAGCASSDKTQSNIVEESKEIEPSIYVNAKGNDNNDGLSENKPLKSLEMAIKKAKLNSINKITVIGTLDHNSEMHTNPIFNLTTDSSEEILITGKPGTSGTTRAILSGKGVKSPVADAHGKTKIRFENIIIANGEGQYGFGLFIDKEASVILGPGSVVQDNQKCGVLLNGICVIKGGEIRNNKECGFSVNLNGVLTMLNGSINNNTSEGGGGVFLVDGGQFIMEDGTISNNKVSISGGGVVVLGRGSLFLMKGGTIANNKSDIYGGGVYAGELGEFRMTGGKITGNSASKAGGGVLSNLGFIGRMINENIFGNTAPSGQDFWNLF